MSEMTIAALARAGGVGVETVRYYQRRKLMKEPPRPVGAGLAGGVRRYGEDDVRRLRFIKSAQTAGFTLEEIGELLALDASADRARAREIAHVRITACAPADDSQVTALDAKLAELTAARAALSRLAEQCSAGDAGPCPIIAAFEPVGGEGAKRS